MYAVSCEFFLFTLFGEVVEDVAEKTSLDRRLVVGALLLVARLRQLRVIERFKKVGRVVVVGLAMEVFGEWVWRWV